MTAYHPPAHYAEQWGIDDDTVRVWCATGELEAVNVAKSPTAKKSRWRISEEAAAEFMARRTRGTAPPATPRRATRKSAAATIKFY